MTKIKQAKWKLVRENDEREWFADEVKWIEWDEYSNKVSSLCDTIEVGRSLILPPFNPYYQWMTTEVTEIIKDTSMHIIFKTKNSTYTLIKLQNGKED